MAEPCKYTCSPTWYAAKIGAVPHVCKLEDGHSGPHSYDCAMKGGQVVWPTEIESLEAQLRDAHQEIAALETKISLIRKVLGE